MDEIKPPRRLAADSASRAVETVGDFWIQLILYCAWHRIRRFDDFVTATGIARSLLANRLAKMVSVGILKREPYQDRPPRFQYRLTPMGLGLHPASMMLVRWERRWHFDPNSPSQRPIHVTCGKEFTPELVCSACNETLVAKDIEVSPGPGHALETFAGANQRRSIYTVPGADALPSAFYRAAELITDRWTSHVVAAAFSKVRRFTDFQERLGIATNILTDRLNRMVEGGILLKRAYQTRPERFEYYLTEQGKDFFPVIVTLQEWGDRWLDGGKGPPTINRHKPCGTRLVSKVICNQCGGAVDHRNVRAPDGAVPLGKLLRS
jgi:DNA-binding HxlR family transcriptional regulator